MSLRSLLKRAMLGEELPIRASRKGLPLSFPSGVPTESVVVRKTISIVCSLAVLSGMALFAQQYSFRSFGVNEGLTNLVIRRIYQDRVGFLWVSTEDGIFRYDGTL